TLATKDLIERARPQVVPRLVVVAGYSYPSGHSLASAAMYLTIGILTARHLRSLRDRLILIGTTALLVVMIALSRVYLGVHYPSDVASGVCLGASWAFLLAALFSVRHSSGVTEAEPEAEAELEADAEAEPEAEAEADIAAT